MANGPVVIKVVALVSNNLFLTFFFMIDIYPACVTRSLVKFEN